jgi:YVTN family beta-propeller protein
MSYGALINDNSEAQVSENTLKSITSQTVPTKAQISVGSGPIFIKKYSEVYMYVANSGSNTVSVIDTRNNILNKTIAVGENPTFIEIIGDYIYVANSGFSYDGVNGTVSVINATSNTMIDTIALGGDPKFIETDENGTALYVATSSDLDDIDYDNGTVSVIDTRNNTVIDTIALRGNPTFTETDENGTALYVATSRDLDVNGTVSVIDTRNNTVIDTITVGDYPTFIETLVVDPDTLGAIGDYLYVANAGFSVDNGTVSVIDTRNNTVIDTITVGQNPIYIETLVVDPDTLEIYLYVANSMSNTLSSIDGIFDILNDTIAVGENPTFIETFGDALYVANFGSNTVSLVDPLTKEEVAGMKFDIKPHAKAGQIICNELDAPIDRFLYVTSGAKCIAKSTTGFEFSSWSQNLPRNTNVTISAATPSDWLGYPLTSLYEVFTDDPAATLTVNRFGNFTAYYKALPSPVPPEFTASLITTIVAALAGSLLIPVALSSYKSKKQTSRLNAFHLDMVSINKDGLDQKDISKLSIMNQTISDYYAAGKITNEQYTNLKNEVYLAFQEIFKKRIESLKEQDLEAINKTRDAIINAYNNGKLSSEYYTNLKNEISNTYLKIFKKRIELVTNPTTEALREIKRDIKDSYATGKIIELHYNLLNEQISDMLDQK